MDIIWTARKRITFFGLPWSFTVYTLTKDKILIDSGFFNKRQEEVRLYRIMDFTLRRNLFQRIFGLGTIICKTADKTMPTLILMNIKSPVEIKERISTMVEEERDKKRVTSREFMGSFDDYEDYDDNEIDN